MTTTPYSRIAGGSTLAVIDGVVAFKGNKKMALRRVKEAKKAGHEAFLGLAPGKNVGDRW